MKFKQNKVMVIAILTILIISIGAVPELTQMTSAHSPAWNWPTYAHISVAPNPIGVGQQVNVFMFLTNYYFGAQYGTDDMRFHNYKLTIVAPNGEVSTQIYGTIKDTTAAQLATFTPDQVGTYKLTFSYPGETYTSTTPISAMFGPPMPNQYTNDTFGPSSASTTLTVQQERIPDPVTSYPLPEEYWARPIYGENTNWWSISSNWLGNGAPNYGGYASSGSASMGFMGGEAMFPGDAIGSQTNHIMWTKPLQAGGVVGGANFNITGQTYFDGSAYIIRYDNPIILDGKIYYKEPIGFGANNNGGAGPLDCVDLRTGNLLWSNPNIPALSFGLIMNVQTQNEHGVCQPILITTSGSNWIGYDADTGNYLCNLTNVPSGAKAMGPDGEYLSYVMANAGTATHPDWRLCQWNSTKVFIHGTDIFSAAPQFGTQDARAPWCYDWNISIPWLNTMPQSVPGNNPVNIVMSKYGDGILCFNGSLPSNGENNLFSVISQTPYTYFFINLNSAKGAIGSVSWWNTLEPPANNYTVIQAGVDWDNRVFLQSLKEGIMWVGYSLDSGKKLWQSEPQAAFDYYGSPSAGILSGQIAYGRLYSCAMAGILYCYDMKTGDLLWTYGNGGEGNSTSSGFNWPYGNIPTFVNAVGNGVIYLVTSEHTWTSPIYKGGLARAVNATDGTEIWTLSSATMEFGSTSYAIADGYSTWFNSYDSSIYVVGRGPSQITVSTPHSGLSWATPLVITGSVTDISSGTTQDVQSARFPNGVPVASDASMKDWMGYVYQQKPTPSNFTGVPVQISVLDSNNNFRTIGVATTDATGTYSLTWTPDIPGDFTVYSSFAGSNGYWPSSATDRFTVMQAPTPVSTAEPVTGLATTSDLLLYVVGAAIAVIIAIGIVGVLLLRKRA